MNSASIKVYKILSMEPFLLLTFDDTEDLTVSGKYL
jgi:hypothetical protein